MDTDIQVIQFVEINEQQEPIAVYHLVIDGEKIAKFNDVDAAKTFTTSMKKLITDAHVAALSYSTAGGF